MAEPPITLRAANDSGTPNGPIARIVIHLTSGSLVFPGTALAGAAHGTAVYFTHPDTPGSAHYVHDAGAAEEHCVPDNTIAWQAPPNPHSIGQEICGHPSWTRAQFLDDQVRPALDHAADRTRELCDRFGVPKVHVDAGQLLAGAHGVTGHDSVAQAWRQSCHWDPGPNFPWDVYMTRVCGSPPPPPKPPPQVTPMVPTWPFGAEYVGSITGPTASHGGAYAWERPFISTAQRWLVFLGCVTGVPSTSWPWTRWADGFFQAPWSTDAVTRFHQRFYPNQRFPDRIYADDWARLVAARP